MRTADGGTGGANARPPLFPQSAGGGQSTALLAFDDVWASCSGGGPAVWLRGCFRTFWVTFAWQPLLLYKSTNDSDEKLFFFCMRK